MLSSQLKGLLSHRSSQVTVPCQPLLHFIPRIFSTKISEDVADVVIVGGGMVGAALAALLNSNPLTSSMRVVLLDQRPQKLDWSPDPFPELRVSTVTPASIRALRKAGAWAAVQGHCAAVESMQVWDDSGSGCVRWHAKDVGLEHMGVVAENSLLQASLLAATQRSAQSGTPSATGEAPPRPPITVPFAEDPELGSSRRAASPCSPSSSYHSSQSGRTVHCMWPAIIKGLELPPFDVFSLQASEQQFKQPSSHGDTAGSDSGVKGSQLATIVFQDDTELKARLVVAADGGASRIRQLAGFRTFGWKYNQRAVVATVQLKGGPTSTAWQRFLPTGPIALLPVRDGLANIVWSTIPEAAWALEQLPPDAFAAAVNKALQHPSPNANGPPPSWSWMASLQQSSLFTSSSAGLQPTAPDSSKYELPPIVQSWVGDSPKSFPLQTQHSGRYVRPRLALIGDAAHSVHPLAGQGVNLGFGDAEALAETIVWARSCGLDPGDLLNLQDRYEKPRQNANLTMAAALDGLVQTFSIQVKPFTAARNLGLNFLNTAKPLRNEVMRIAMGL